MEEVTSFRDLSGSFGFTPPPFVHHDLKVLVVIGRLSAKGDVIASKPAIRSSGIYVKLTMIVKRVWNTSVPYTLDYHSEFNMNSRTTCCRLYDAMTSPMHSILPITNNTFKSW